MNFLNPPSDGRTLELEDYIQPYIQAAQDKRDLFADFTRMDQVTSATQVSAVETTPAVPTPAGNRLEAPDPVTPEEGKRFVILQDFDALRIESSISDSNTIFQRIKQQALLNIEGLMLRKANMYVAGAKGSVLIQNLVSNPQDPSAITKTADDDGVIRLDAVGATLPSGRDIAISFEDMSAAIARHEFHNIGNSQGIAGGTLPQAQLATMPFFTMTPYELENLKADRPGDSASWGTINYEKMVETDGKAHTLKKSYDTFHGYPILVGGVNDPVHGLTVLDAGGDSEIIDLGGGNFAKAYDVIVSTGDAVMRGMSPVITGIKESEDKTAIKKISLNFLMNAMRLRGKSLVFLRVQQPIDLFQATSLLSSPLTKLVSGYDFANRKIESLLDRGIKVSETPHLASLCKLAVGKPFTAKHPKEYSEESRLKHKAGIHADWRKIEEKYKSSPTDSKGKN